MIEIEGIHMYLDGELIAVKTDAPTHWARRVFGKVLEVGLGFGVLAREVAEKRPGSHTIIERSSEVVGLATTQKWVPESARLILGEFPGIDLPEDRYDCILLDVPRTGAIEQEALRIVSDGGMIFVRNRTA